MGRTCMSVATNYVKKKNYAINGAQFKIVSITKKNIKFVHKRPYNFKK